MGRRRRLGWRALTPVEEGDVESHLQTILLLVTFTLGFALSFSTQFQSGELKDWDKFYATAPGRVFIGKPRVRPRGVMVSFLPSATMLHRTMWANVLLFTALILSVSAYLSFTLVRHECRRVSALLARWHAVFRWIVALAWVTFGAGTTFLVAAMVAAMYGIFPMYCDVVEGALGTRWRPANWTADAANPDHLEQGCVNRFSETYIGTYFRTIIAFTVAISIGVLSLGFVVRYVMTYDVDDVGEETYDAGEATLMNAAADGKRRADSIHQ